MVNLSLQYVMVTCHANGDSVGGRGGESGKGGRKGWVDGHRGGSRQNKTSTRGEHLNL